MCVCDLCSNFFIYIALYHSAKNKEFCGNGFYAPIKFEFRLGTNSNGLTVALGATSRLTRIVFSYV